MTALDGEGTERVGPYELEGVLGRGAMGVVHRARDAAGRAVALKRIAVRDEELARRLVREADVRVVHPNVVRVLGAGLDARGEPYVVTELLEGESMHARMHRALAAGAVDVAETVALFAQAAEGLAALHAAGIVHRDVKPSNLFVTEDGVVKVLDFGTAAFADASTILTATGALLGTPAYLSPEQARGEREIDGRSDVWSLGMSLYHALTGELPFRRSSVVASALAVQHDPLPSVLELAPEVPLEVATIVERCLARRAEDRPGAAEVARLLREAPVDAAGRPSQPLVAPTEEAWRSVAIAVIADARDRARIEELARSVEGAATRILARSEVIVLGGERSHGDELDRAIDLALAAAPYCRAVVVGDARARRGGGEIEPTSLGEAEHLLARGETGVILTARAAAIAGRGLRLEPRDDGSARVLGRELTPPSVELVGRDAELAALDELACSTRDSRLAARAEVVGPPGLGKTALVRTWIERLPALVPGALAVPVSGRGARGASAAGTPYAPLLDALEVAVDPGPDRPRTGVAPVDAQGVLDRRRVAVLDALGEHLVSAPLVALVVDDLHGADDHTRALVAELPVLFGDRPLVVVTTARDGHDAPASPAPALRLALAPLSPPAISALVRRVLGGEDARTAGPEIAARAGGNPLFAVHLAAARHAARARSASGAELPPTIESAVQARLDALPDELRAAAYTMAALGPEGTLTEARLALGARADRWIAALTAAGVLEPSRSAPASSAERPAWQFASRLVAEVARAALDAESARALHRAFAERLAAAWEAEHAAREPARRPTLHPEVVLRHADQAGDEALARRFVREAFFAAARVGDGRRVLELLPRARAASDAPFDVVFAAAEAAAFVADGPGVEPLLVEARTHARSADERALVHAELGERARRRGLRDEARAHLEQALAERASPAIALRARCRLALVLVSEGEAERALELLDEPLAPPHEGELPPATRALVADTRGYLHGARGALGPRRAAYEEAARLYAAAGDARRAAGADANLGDTLRQMGDLEAAEAALRRAREGARAVGNRLTEAYACANLGATLLAAERRREALATLELAARSAHAVGDARLAATVELYRARAEARAPSAATLAEVERLADPTLCALALAPLLEHGAPTPADLARAAAILESDEELEEGALELGRALHARGGLGDRARARLLCRIERAYRTIDREPWRRRYVAHVAHTGGAPVSEWADRAAGA